MKRKIGKLSLSRETLRTLSHERLLQGAVGGATNARACSNVCSITRCDECNPGDTVTCFNGPYSCGNTCQASCNPC
jgi:hypothetical protein